MEKSRVSYKIEHNNEDYFFPITVKTLHDDNVVFTDFAETIDEACKVIKERESSLKDSVPMDDDRGL